ncbi:MAG: bifunctional diaminohydroxyphosphoribosylaminopyrimidine deaminase/5-amino-6-(5-phosphoribosylamino)uracil reductase RibD, partial [Candidatus Omnitrophota bacterium]|nr:bifunctional diaminohydroxyphosphoribosylaminopyrimidine deaminase/5-amino-6-(5-phosphoribosylamino)uracil reductase RibD [Candidatus Omnitrophota bacterium]
MNIDEKYMRMALSLAKRGEGLTSPNPAVGAVIVKNGNVVGRGFHKRRGLPHAEVNALNAACGRAKGATLYVTLEPCGHFGKTPPCADAIIRAKINRVVIGMKDPNPVNDGRGIRKLNRAGIKTSVGILESEAKELNKPFIKFMTTGLPYVTVKMAESLDGKIATRTGDSKWITGADSRRYVHRLRARADAVMVGANTAIKDDPVLLSKISDARQPARIIVCGGVKIKPNSRIFATSDISPVYLAINHKRGRRVDLKSLLKKLGRMGMIHILVEGGGELVASLVDDRLVDEFLFFIAPKIIGGRNAVTPVEGKGVARIDQALVFNTIKVRRFEKDILIEAEV